MNGEILKSEITYGYGSHYLQTAAELLKENGYDIPEDNGKAYAYVIDFPHTVEDVKRKKTFNSRNSQFWESTAGRSPGADDGRPERENI